MGKSTWRCSQMPRLVRLARALLLQSFPSEHVLKWKPLPASKHHSKQCSITAVTESRNLLAAFVPCPSLIRLGRFSHNTFWLSGFGAIGFPAKSLWSELAEAWSHE